MKVIKVLTTGLVIEVNADETYWGFFVREDIPIAVFFLKKIIV